ncbi:MAG TPA: MarR family winged helix-turn-helix transcriptional regulator [Candidatus Micrarchaeia archaeon]|nr:MarR family winged helix-turn-helix transcriptional regulator [Candidatus Micrarchaeia archaeon]
MPIARSDRLPAEFAGHPIALLVRVGAEARRRLAGRLAEHGAALPLYAILAWLDHNGPRCQRELGDALGLDPGDVVRLLDQLENATLVRRDPDLTDRRRHRLTLTAAGRTERDRCQQAMVALEVEWLAPLSPAERELLAGLLTRLGEPAADAPPRGAPPGPRALPEPEVAASA